MLSLGECQLDPFAVPHKSRLSSKRLSPLFHLCFAFPVYPSFLLIHILSFSFLSPMSRLPRGPHSSFPFSASSNPLTHFFNSKYPSAGTYIYLSLPISFFKNIRKMATFLLKLSLLISIVHLTFAARRLIQPQDQDQLLHYHNGPLLYGKIAVNPIWYGNFKPSQKAIITDFITSLSSSQNTQPSVATWWRTTEKYYHLTSKKASSLSLSLGDQILDETYSLGKSLTLKNLVHLASKGGQRNAINVVLTAADVAVEGFCMSRCGTHGSSSSTSHVKDGKNYKFAYIWVGNSETQCPGQCAWPFHQPIYGPQSPPLIAPNNDVGLDGMVINLASLLAGTATNPFGNGYFQGSAEAPLEASTACPGVYGKGAYPGYAGDLLVDPTTGASYNVNGANGRKYLVPALYDPSTLSCSTPV
ncbi:hypothetical protein Fmac_007870 [Flemingia macrophylla]|uniref:Uncharacterized protein n=1 Tax=Flemingia macrophylla TaxID=520843 RepID=A0ABD1MVS8_9FABA